MMRCQSRAEAELTSEVADAALPLAEERDDAGPGGFGDGLEPLDDIRRETFVQH